MKLSQDTDMASVALQIVNTVESMTTAIEEDDEVATDDKSEIDREKVFKCFVLDMKDKAGRYYMKNKANLDNIATKVEERIKQTRPSFKWNKDGGEDKKSNITEYIKEVNTDIEKVEQVDATKDFETKMGDAIKKGMASLDKIKEEMKKVKADNMFKKSYGNNTDRETQTKNWITNNVNNVINNVTIGIIKPDKEYAKKEFVWKDLTGFITYAATDLAADGEILNDAQNGSVVDLKALFKKGRELKKDFSLKTLLDNGYVEKKQEETSEPEPQVDVNQEKVNKINEAWSQNSRVSGTITSIVEYKKQFYIVTDNTMYWIFNNFGKFIKVRNIKFVQYALNNGTELLGHSTEHME